MGRFPLLSLGGFLLMYPGLLVAAPAEDVRLFVGDATRYGHLQRPERFWHITDLHLDASYHLADDPTKVCLSSKGAPAANAGPYGDFLCDSPYSLIQSAFNHMNHMTPQADFIIWTGDSPPHVPALELSTDLVIQAIGNMSETIRHHFPTLPIFPALGNHDYWPQGIKPLYHGAPTQPGNIRMVHLNKLTDQMPGSANAIYQAVAKLWAPWLQDEALRTLSEGGFYSQLARPGLRVISLNTILYYGPDKATANDTDPAGQFLWLQGTLERAAQNLEKVFIIAHVPVGYLPFTRDVTAIRKRHNERLVYIFRKFSHVITGHFYGHTHRDSVMVLLDEEGKPVNSIFVSPAVTPIKSVLEPYSNNPAFRMAFYDATDFSLLDIWQYYLNLTEANERRRADWRREYVMTEAFGLEDLRPHSLLQLALSFRLPQATSFDKYFSHFMVSYDKSIRCEDACKLHQVCAVLHLDDRAHSKCVQGRNLQDSYVLL